MQAAGIADVSPEKIEKITELVMESFMKEDASIGVGSGKILEKIVEELILRAAEIKKKRIQVHCAKMSTKNTLRAAGIPAYCSGNKNDVPMIDYYVETANTMCNISKTDQPRYQLFIRTDPVCQYSWLLAKNARVVHFVVNGPHIVTKTVRGIPMELANTVDGRAFYKTWVEKMGGQIALRRNFDASPDRFYVEWAPEQVEVTAENAKTIYEWRIIQQELNNTACVLSHNLYCASNCSLMEPKQ